MCGQGVSAKHHSKPSLKLTLNRHAYSTRLISRGAGAAQRRALPSRLRATAWSLPLGSKRAAQGFTLQIAIHWVVAIIVPPKKRPLRPEGAPQRERESVETRCKRVAHTPNPLLNSLLIGTLHPLTPARLHGFAWAFPGAFDKVDKVTDKATKLMKSPEGAQYTSPGQRSGE